MKKDDLKAAAIQAQLEINEQIDEFIESLDAATNDPNDFISFTQFEKMWRSLELRTHKTYSDMASRSLSVIDTSEVNKSKKANSSERE